MEESNSSIVSVDAEKAVTEEQSIEFDMTGEASDRVLKGGDNIAAEKACTGDTFYCELCDFVSSWETGLKVHESRKHKNIEQLDGEGCYDDMIHDEKLKKLNTTGKLEC